MLIIINKYLININIFFQNIINFIFTLAKDIKPDKVIKRRIIGIQNNSFPVVSFNN